MAVLTVVVVEVVVVLVDERYGFAYKKGIVKEARRELSTCVEVKSRLPNETMMVGGRRTTRRSSRGPSNKSSGTGAFGRLWLLCLYCNQAAKFWPSASATSHARPLRRHRPASLSHKKSTSSGPWRARKSISP
nr:hypothetical protein CFP56_57586 [Quercus suber]